MAALRGDSREPSDIRADALARAITYLLSLGYYYDGEAVALFPAKSPRAMWRVWMRLSVEHRQRLSAEARATKAIALSVISFLDEMEHNG